MLIRKRGQIQFGPLHTHREYEQTNKSSQYNSTQRNAVDQRFSLFIISFITNFYYYQLNNRSSKYDVSTIIQSSHWHRFIERRGKLSVAKYYSDLWQAYALLSWTHIINIYHFTSILICSVVIIFCKVYTVYLVEEGQLVKIFYTYFYFTLNVGMLCTLTKFRFGCVTFVANCILPHRHTFHAITYLDTLNNDLPLDLFILCLQVTYCQPL